MQTVPEIAPGELPDVPANELVDLDSLHVDPRNPQDHGSDSVEAVAASLAEFGQQKPVVVDASGVLIAGHGTVTAARALGWRRIWAVRSELEGEDRSGYQIADNATAQHAVWNGNLAELVQEIHEHAPEKVSALGLTDDKVAELLLDASGANENDGEEVPEPVAPPQDPRTRVGDVWHLGEHRVLCGDSTEPEAYRALLGDEEASLVWTDPPYGVAYDGGPKPKAGLPRSAIENDALSPEALESFLFASLGAALTHCREGACWYVAAPAGPLFLPFAKVLASMEVWRQTLVWEKQTLVLGRSDFHYRHEAIFYGWKPGAAHRSPKERTHDTIWEFDRPTSSPDHPTMKPVPLILHALRLSSGPGELVLDPFCGSGSTILAAEEAGRVGRGIELAPSYVDVIVRRWQEHTGRDATLGASGPAFDSVDPKSR